MEAILFKASINLAIEMAGENCGLVCMQDTNSE